MELLKAKRNNRAVIITAYFFHAVWLFTWGRVGGIICKSGDHSTVRADTYACGALIGFTEWMNYTVARSLQQKSSVRLFILQQHCILLTDELHMKYRPLQQCYCTADNCNDNVIVLRLEESDWPEQVEFYSVHWDRKKAGRSLKETLLFNMQHMPALVDSGFSNATRISRNVNSTDKTNAEHEAPAVQHNMLIIALAISAACVAVLAAAANFCSLALRRRTCKVDCKSCIKDRRDASLKRPSLQTANAAQISQTHDDWKCEKECECECDVTDEVLAISACCKVMKGLLRKVPDGLVSCVAVKQQQSVHRWHNAAAVHRYLAQFKHGNLVPFVAAYTRPDNTYVIVTELQCGSLLSHLQRNVISWKQLLSLTEGVARGLAFMHSWQQGEEARLRKLPIAHRNLQSGNVLLTDDLTPKIASFDDSRIITQLDDFANLQSVGSALYSPPEVLDGSVEYSLAAVLSIDLYSLGVLLWEMMVRCAVKVKVTKDPDMGQGQGQQLLVQCDEYRLPLPADCAPNPSEAQLKILVCIKRCRPPISELWRSHHLRSKFVRIVEELWDEMPSCRLPAGSVETKVTQLAQVSAEDDAF